MKFSTLQAQVLDVAVHSIKRNCIEAQFEVRPKEYGTTVQRRHHSWVFVAPAILVPGNVFRPTIPQMEPRSASLRNASNAPA